jgi:RNA polymerase sigma factor (sigma-70 family)
MTCHMDVHPGALRERAGRSGERLMVRAELERDIEELHPASYSWALGCCRRNRDDAEEVLQNVYVMVLEGRARFDGRSSLKTWLFAVIRRASLAHFRTRWLREARLIKWFGANEEPQTGDGSGELEASQTAAQLLAALSQLPRRQREVVELVFYHDMTVDQAAVVMGVGAGSARVHYDRAKKRLRILLAAEVAP